MSWRTPVTRGALLLMESMWTYAAIATWVALAARGGRPSFLAVAVVVFLSYTLSRALQNSDLELDLIRAWGTVASFVLFYGIARVAFFGDWRFWDFGWANDLFNHFTRVTNDHLAAFWGIPVLWLAWMRGLVRGQDRYGWNDTLGAFAIGVLVVAAAEVLQSFASDAPALVRQLPVPFGALGLISIGLAHAGRGEEGTRRAFGFTWVAAVGGAIAVIAVLSGLFAVAYYQAAGNGFDQTARSVGDVASTLGSYLIWPLDQLIYGIYEVLEFLLRILGLRTGVPPEPPANAGDISDCIRARVSEGMALLKAEDACSTSPKHIPGFFKLAGEVFLVGTCLYILSRLTLNLFKRFQKRKAPLEIKESTYQDGRLGKDLGDLLGAIARRFRPNLHLGRERLDPVQRLYFDMIEDAANRGIQRKASETALELAPTLVRSYAGEAPREITEVFDDVRYGGHAALETEARRLRREWEELQAKKEGP